jgi:hypothetical protein
MKGFRYPRRLRKCYYGIHDIDKTEAFLDGCKYHIKYNYKLFAGHRTLFWKPMKLKFTPLK